jgi:hypothetical protein
MPDDPCPLSQVLIAELEAIKGRPDNNGETIIRDDAGGTVPLRADAAAEAEELNKRRSIYASAHRLSLSALCLSGGGIRSAAVSLGVIQALADRGLLNKFHYLSTVSGGGYIGSWLTAWLSRGNATNVVNALTSRRNNSDREPPPIAHLRRYSNYLTPSAGLFSADTWTAFVIVARNILINWLILLPALTILVCVVHLISIVIESGDGRGVMLVSTLCVIFGGLSFGYKLYHLYSRTASRDRATLLSAQGWFLLGSLLPASLAGLCFTWLVLQKKTPGDILTPLLPDWLVPTSGFASTLCFALAVYVVAMVVAGCRAIFSVPPPPDAVVPPRPTWIVLLLDFACWAVGVLVFATVVWLWAKAATSIHPSYTLASTTTDKPAVFLDGNLLVVVFGMPCFLLATLLAHTIYLLLHSSSRIGDVEREWLGRAGGWHFIAMLAWIGLAAIVLLGPAVFQQFERLLGDVWGKVVSGGVTGILGAVTAVLGKSGVTPAQGRSEGKAAVSATVILAIAGPLFAAFLLIFVSSLVLDYAPAFDGIKISVLSMDQWYNGTRGIALILAAAFLILLVADGFANINAFSLHAIYRNRLVRAFLGGARTPGRHPDGFTDFDWGDDMRVAGLWNGPPDGDNWRPFHVINMTLNLSSTDNLAWQQRKAMPFTASPLHCGNADLGYRPTEDYAGPARQRNAAGQIVEHGGISLGTAMAISGAAVSSNMGYYSSKPLSFLMTFFNVRLGCWLGNPGEGGNPRWYSFGKPFRREGPRFAVKPLLNELFGVTSDMDAYVNLSDGGHFEDLGLYEMVRRRCKFIVVCDGDEDANRGFEDLGNAVRKIWIDLGVRITFERSRLLRADGNTKPRRVPYLALGKIKYVSDVPAGAAVPTGHLLYIKPFVRGDEAAADIIAYKRANKDFPDQSTANQWFDEPQLESYRRLGHLMTSDLMETVPPQGAAIADLDLLFNVLAQTPNTHQF